MAARSRPRAGMVKDDSADAHEERNMWNQIVTDVKKLKQINAKAAEISAQIVELEAAMAKIDPETGNGRFDRFQSIYLFRNAVIQKSLIYTMRFFSLKEYGYIP